MPVAAALARTIEEWLPGAESGSIAMAAHLEGGQVECKFTLYRCVGTAPKTEWKPRDEWSIERADERDEPAAELTLPLQQDLSSELLLAQLAAFVTKVDVPDMEKPPETAPIPHP
jgi:hypothetical protein